MDKTIGAAKHGTLTRRNGKMYVVCATTENTHPVRHVLWWAVARTYHDPYTDRTPRAGDAMAYRGDGVWSAGSSGSGGAVETGGAEIREQVDVLPPMTSGKELRWHQGRWEQRLAMGWAAAGEGDGKRKERACG